MSIKNKFLKPISQNEVNSASLFPIDGDHMLVAGSLAMKPIYSDPVPAVVETPVSVASATVEAPVSVASATVEAPVSVAPATVEAPVSVASATVEAPAAEIPVVSKKVSLASYFASKGLTLRATTRNADIAPVEPLAFLVASNYSSCKLFLKQIRENYCKKIPHFSYCVAKLPKDAKAEIVNLAEKFGEYGIISNQFYNRTTDMITGNLSFAPRVVNFLNGDYLEFYGRAVVQRVVKEMAQKYGTDYEICNNAIISGSEGERELDVLFRVGDCIFWSEIKSGKFSDYDAYRKLGRLLNLNPDRHILLSAEADDTAAGVISWFYQFYVANINSFELKLISMIDTAFTEGGMNDE